jgi:hypothetical protein
MSMVLALVGGGFLVEAVPAAATHAAHELFPSSFSPKSSAKFTSRRFLGALIAHIYGVFSENKVGDLCCQNHPCKCVLMSIFARALLLM